MKYLLRPDRTSAIIALAGIAALAALVPQAIRAQGATIAQVIEQPSPLLLSSSPGYLGVLVGDVDNESAQKLKLKEVRGAVVTLIDHDAPAGQILKINDVVLELNGQAVEGAEQLRRMLREIPAGRKISLLISRDGNEQTLATQMGDQKKIEKSVWKKMSDGGDVFPSPAPANSLLSGGDTGGTGSWHIPFFSPTLHVGVMVEPLTSQMAEYLGVSSGLMVKQVARKTEADTAGLKAFDVILKVGTETIATAADWERALHANEGKPVQLTILRDKRQQTITLQVDSKHNKGELEMEDLFPGEDCPLVAELDSQQMADGARAFAEQMREQAESLRDQMKDFTVDPKQAEQMREQAEALREQLKSGLGEFKVSPEQAEQMRRQAEALHDQLKSFHFDRKQLDEWNRQMQDWQKTFNADQFKLDQKQLDEWNKQMQQWREQFDLDFGDADPQFI